MITIRKVNPNDSEMLAAILRMDQKCFPSDLRYPTSGAHWWVALDGSTPVGYAGIKPLGDPGIVYLCRLGVLPMYRHQGLARRLVQIRLRWARKHNYTAVVTDTWNNIPSANNLIRCGFTLYEPYTKWATSEALYWWLDL